MEFLVFAFINFYILWIFYLAVMNLKRARDSREGLSKLAYYLGVPILIVGLILDFIINVFILSILFLEFPRETTVTSRLKRHKLAGGWRSKVVKKFFVPLLDQFDPSGVHI